MAVTIGCEGASGSGKVVGAIEGRHHIAFVPQSSRNHLAIISSLKAITGRASYFFSFVSDTVSGLVW